MTEFDEEFLYLADPVLRVNREFGLGYMLDPKQEDIIRSTSQQLIVCCTRQWGKTTTVAAKAATEAIGNPGLILVVAPVERQARECFRKIKGFPNKSVKTRWPESNKTSLELPDGARVVALPAKGDSIRGYTNPRLIIIDEAAFVSDEDYKAVRPMLSHGARLIVMSTPFGKRGWFYEAWQRTDGDWDKIFVTADECKHISRKFLAEERIELVNFWYSQEYECKFLDSVDSYFDMDAVRRGLEDNIEPLFSVRQGEQLNITDDIEPLFGVKA